MGPEKPLSPEVLKQSADALEGILRGAVERHQRQTAPEALLRRIEVLESDQANLTKIMKGLVALASFAAGAAVAAWFR